MPLTVAVCDDSEEQIAELRRLLGQWSENKPFALTIDEYISAESFIFSYPDRPCDILLLDIEMKELNGMELARRLRNGGDKLPVIFITGYAEYMSDGYEVEALHYLLKPVNKEKLFEVLDKYVKRRGTKKDGILLRCGEKVLRALPEEIACIEAEGKKSLVRFSDGRSLLCESGINDIIKPLSDSFLLCHRSFAVNIGFVRSISKDGITLDSGEKIPVSRRLYKEVNRRFIDFYAKG